MKFTVGNLSQAKEVASHFNKFHDGFFRRICVVSMDEFRADGAQIMTGELEVTAEIAPATHPKAGCEDSIVHCHFFGVNDISIKLPTEAENWNIYSLTFPSAVKDGRELPDRLKCRLAVNCFFPSREWTVVEHCLFTFKEALFDDKEP